MDKLSSWICDALGTLGHIDPGHLHHARRKASAKRPEQGGRRLGGEGERRETRVAAREGKEKEVSGGWVGLVDRFSPLFIYNEPVGIRMGHLNVNGANLISTIGSITNWW